jgi:hypothetical protein
LRYGVYIMSHQAKVLRERIRHVFVEFYLHDGSGTCGTGISSSAEAAAKAMTART